MEIKNIQFKNFNVVEIISPDILISNSQDALDIMANADSQNIILYKHNFTPDFFELKTLKLGEVLQKFTNYQVRLAIIGNFDEYESKSLRDFIYESNKNKNYLFVDTIENVKQLWEK